MSEAFTSFRFSVFFFFFLNLVDKSKRFGKANLWNRCTNGIKLFNHFVFINITKCYPSGFFLSIIRLKYFWILNQMDPLELSIKYYIDIDGKMQLFMKIQYSDKLFNLFLIFSCAIKQFTRIYLTINKI